MTASKANFPAPIVHIIAQYAAQWTIMRWIAEQLPEPDIPEPGHDGPIIINEYIDRAGRDSINWVLMDPMAEDYVRGRYVYQNDIPQLAENAANWALDILEKLDIFDKGELVIALCKNTNPRAIAMLAEYDKSLYNWCCLSANPSAIGLLRANPEMIDHDFIMRNPAAEDLIKEQKIEINYTELQCNPGDWAMKLFFAHSKWKENIFDGFAGNAHPLALEQIRLHVDSMHHEDIEWNPGAIDIIGDHLDLFPIYEDILANPGIFEPTIPAGLKAEIMSV